MSHTSTDTFFWHSFRHSIWHIFSRPPHLSHISSISYDILSGISSGILSGISSGIFSDILSGILSGISSDILSGVSSDILSDILSGIYFDIFFWNIFGVQNILSGISYDILSDIFSDILSGISSDILSGISSDILSRIFSHILPVEVQQCPLRSGSRGWGPAVPTAIWKSRLKSGSAHCDLEVAVEVRQCPLRFGSRGWGPAVPTAIWKSRLRSGSAHWDLELAVGVRQCPLGSGARGRGPAVPTGIWTARRRWRRRRRRRTALIKSNNPHLAGGEKCKTCLVEVSMGAWHFFTEPSKTNLPIWTQAKTVGHLLDISVPNFLCCVKAWPAWRNFWKTTVFAPVMVGNFDSGCPEASGACWNVLLFLNNKLTIFSDVWMSTYLFGHMLLLLLLFLLLLLLLLLFPETVFMQMWPHDKLLPATRWMSTCELGQMACPSSYNFCMRTWPHRIPSQMPPATQQSGAATSYPCFPVLLEILVLL